MDILKKVGQLKNSFSVEGSPLIKSDRFSDKEMIKIRNSSKAHSSHFYHLGPAQKTYSDDEIYEQISTMLLQNVFDEQYLKDKIETMYKSLPLVDIKSEKDFFTQEIYKLIGWDKLTPLDGPDQKKSSWFWAQFGSAPFSISSSNKNLKNYAKKYGACGMDEIFGEKFGKTYFYTYFISNTISEFDSRWNILTQLKRESLTIYSSPFDNIKDLEENVTIKNSMVESRKFYMDKSKKLEDRVQVFSKYGKKESSIIEPHDPFLKKIFDIYLENPWIERHQMVNTVDVVYSWVDKLSNNRCKLDWTNKHHPEVKKETRNYLPSKNAIDRLYQYYAEKLFLEEIGSFEMDW